MPSHATRLEDLARVHDTPVRVRYGEVDRMGFVYHGHYLVYFEQGRTEYLRSLGATYRELEETGTLLVVVETGQRFLSPAGYDDHLTIRTGLTEVRGVRLRFDYEVRRDGDLLATGFTVLASCDSAGRPRRMPEALRAILATVPCKGGATADVQDASRGSR